MINLTDLFPYRKSFTDIVSFATDSFAAVDSKTFASLPADVECGDAITSTGAAYTSGDDNVSVADKAAAVAALEAKGFVCRVFYTS